MLHKITSLYQVHSTFAKGEHILFLEGILVSLSAGLSVHDNNICTFLQKTL